MAFSALRRSSLPSRVSASSGRRRILERNFSTGSGERKAVAATSMFRVSPFSQGRKLCLYPSHTYDMMYLSFDHSATHLGDLSKF